jgi:hypothetical protein
MQLTRLIYASRATKAMDKNELAGIVCKAAERNATLSITGMLVYGNGNFLQVLEGDVFRVVELYEKILKDPRHGGLIRLSMQPAQKRLFTRWSMGVVNLGERKSVEMYPLKVMVRLAESLRAFDQEQFVVGLVKEFTRQLEGNRAA